MRALQDVTPEAPLLGKHVGTYWWAAQARGKSEHGVVEKDYRVRLDQGLGREYEVANEHAEIAVTAPEHSGLDPDLGGRGLRAHNTTQNALAEMVRDAGASRDARSPTSLSTTSRGKPGRRPGSRRSRASRPRMRSDNYEQASARCSATASSLKRTGEPSGR